VVVKAQRFLIGKHSGISSRQRIYRTPDAIEIEEVEGYDVTRKRVFFDDVLFVTYHRFLGWPFLLGMGVLTAFFGLITVAASLGNPRVGLVLFVLWVLPFLALFVLRLILRVDAVTVYGKRTKAQMHFWFRKQRARQLYQEICRQVRQRQESLARQAAARVPQPSGPPPITDSPLG
jgi:hypothetical protein